MKKLALAFALLAGSASAQVMPNFGYNKTTGALTFVDKNGLSPVICTDVAGVCGTTYTSGAPFPVSAASVTADTDPLRSWCLIADGSSHQLSTVTSCNGVSTSGWTLGQWQAVLPAATALTDEVDWAAIQSYVNSTNANAVLRGTAMINKTITLSDSDKMIGASTFAAVIKPTAAMSALVTIVANTQAEVRNIRFTNVTAFAPEAILVNKGHSGLYNYIIGNYIDGGFTHGIYIQGGDEMVIRENIISNSTSGYGIYINDDGTGSVIEHNAISGGNGVLIQTSGATNEGIILAYNEILSTGYAVNITSCLECKMLYNVFTQQIYTVGTDVVRVASGSPNIYLMKSTGNWYAQQTSGHPNTTAALRITGPQIGFYSSQDTFISQGGYNIIVDGGAGFVQDLTLTDANFGQATPALQDISLTRVANGLIKGAMFAGSANTLVVDAASWGRLDGSAWLGGGACPSIASTSFFVGNHSLVCTTISTVTAAILSGTTSIVFNHGLSFGTPSPSAFTVVPTTIPTNDTGNYTISGCTATQCTLSVRNNPGASNAQYAIHGDISK